MKGKIKKSANFDSLAFKEAAQKRLRLETKGMTPREEMEYLHQQALNGPFAHLYKRHKNQTPAATRVGKVAYLSKPDRATNAKILKKAREVDKKGSWVSDDLVRPHRKS